MNEGTRNDVDVPDAFGSDCRPSGSHAARRSLERRVLEEELLSPLGWYLWQLMLSEDIHSVEELAEAMRECGHQRDQSDIEDDLRLSMSC